MHKLTSMKHSRCDGFTLVELIMVVVIVGIISIVVGPILARPFLAFEDVSTRANLTSMGEHALHLVTLDLKNSVPNSIRINGTVLEMTVAQTGGRYRLGLAGDDTALVPNGSDQRFNALGALTFPNNARVVVFNVVPADFYADAANNSNPGVISPVGATAAACAACVPAETEIDLGVSHRFDDTGAGSPANRFLVVTRPTTYHCDTAGTGTLMRYEGYDFSAVQITDRATLAATATSIGELADEVSACSFTFDPGTAYRAATITMTLEFQNAENQNAVRLMRQLHVRNAP